VYHYPKEFLTVSQLIQKLVDSGMIITPEDNTQQILSTIGYYRLKGYSYHLIDPINHSYKSGTYFSNILKLYFFNNELSKLLFDFSSQIEISLRTRLINAFQYTNDPLILNDASVFQDKSLYWKNFSSISKEIERSKDAFISHNFKTYEGAIPIWAIVEVLSFGTLSKIIKNLKTGSNTAFSALVQNYRFEGSNGLITPSKKMLTSWIYSVSILRNICAHNGRIYNRTIDTKPQLILTDVLEPAPSYYGLYQVMLAMKYLRPSNETWIQFIKDFKSILNTYARYYELERLSFPEDWENHF
jgi:abortive infection bacteriophage resistance protein